MYGRMDEWMDGLCEGLVAMLWGKMSRAQGFRCVERMLSVQMDG